LAVCGGSVKLIEMLFEYGAQLSDDAVARTQKSPLAQAVRTKNTDCLIVLLNRGFKPLPGGETLSPLMNAIVLKLFDAVGPLLDRGADPNYMNPSKSCALYLAIKSGQLDLVQRLLDRGARANFRGPSGATAIHATCQAGSLDILKCLMKTGVVDAKAVDDRGRLATFSVLTAAPAVMLPILHYLIVDLELDINAKDRDGNTLLLEVVTDKGRMTPELAQFMLERKADMSVKAKNGKTMFELVMEVCSPEVRAVFNRHLNPRPTDPGHGKSLKK
jgi:ankyrin repeat protein